MSTYSGSAGTAGFTEGSGTPTAFNAITTTVKYNGPVGIFRAANGSFTVTDSENCCVRTISPSAPPTLPTSLHLTALTKNSATISWSGDTGATFYSYSISPKSESIVFPTSTQSPATFTGLRDSTEYMLSLLLGNSAGVVYPPAVRCVTPIDSAEFVLTVPSTSSIGGMKENSKIVSATLSWKSLSII